MWTSQNFTKQQTRTSSQLPNERERLFESYISCIDPQMTPGT